MEKLVSQKQMSHKGLSNNMHLCSIGLDGEVDPGGGMEGSRRACHGVLPWVRILEAHACAHLGN
jgi:hypothetical protein